MKSRVVDCEGGGMEPVTEWQNSKIKIIVACCRSVNDDGSDKTIAILN